MNSRENPAIAPLDLTFRMGIVTLEDLPLGFERGQRAAHLIQRQSEAISKIARRHRSGALHPPAHDREHIAGGIEPLCRNPELPPSSLQSRRAVRGLKLPDPGFPV